jgi:hypothetical protein
LVNPLAAAPVVAVSWVGAAEGARGAAAALACAGSDPDRSSLLIDVGGRPPRPTLLASEAAQRLERRLVAHLPVGTRIAARGSVCQLAVSSEVDGLGAASAAVAVARDALSVLHLAPRTLREMLDGGFGPSLTGVLLRADPQADRALLALVVRELIGRGLSVAVLKRRLNWVVERRALFGALGPETPGGLPTRLANRLLSHQCYAPIHDPEPDPTRTAQREWGDHASAGSR